MESFQQRILVRWSDLDPNAHVRHSAYYDYGAQVRIAHLQKCGFSIDWMTRKGIGPILFREEARFYRELKSGDELVVDVRLSGVSADHRKWSMRHRIMRGDELCATIELDGAWLDRNTRRVVPPPKELVERFEAMEHTEDFAVIDAEKK